MTQASHGVGLRQVWVLVEPFQGKLVVAVTEDELPKLDDIERRARENQVPGIKRLDAREMREIEPQVAGVAAVHSPETAVVDYAAITEAMAEDVRRAGGLILLGQEVTAVDNAAGTVNVSTTAGSLPSTA